MQKSGFVSPNADCSARFKKEGGAWMFARKMMRPFGLALLLMVVLFGVGLSARAADDPVDFTIQITPDSLTAPGEATVTLRVSNPTNTDMVYPVFLLDPDGNLVSSFGDGGQYVLRSGESRSWEGKWNVTQEQLDQGGITYTLRYHLEDETGGLVELNRQATARIAFVGERVKLTVTRAINPEVVRPGGTATVTYELYNSGNVDLTNIRVTEHISRNAQRVTSLAAGERATVTFTSKIGNADLTSNATVTYQTVGSTKTLTEKVEDAVIPRANPNLKLELSTPLAGVNVNEPATLVITFINDGNITYSNVTVTEAQKGEILTNITIPAGATVTETKQFILTEPTTFKVTANLPDNTGETNQMTSKELKIGVYDPEKTMLLTLNLTADIDGLYTLPTDTRFHLTVTNNSNVKAEKVTISHGDTAIYVIDSLDSGASIVLDRDVRISHPGKFQFTATAKDSMNNTVTFTSNTIQLNRVDATPVPTKAPVVTVAPPVLVTPIPNDPILEQGRNAMLTAAVAIGVLLGAALVLFIVSTVVRQYRKSKSNAAYDHLDLAERRDYTEPAGEEMDEEPEEAPDQGAESPDAAETQTLREDEDRVLPHERLIKTEEAPAKADADESPLEEEGGYRVSRGGAAPVLTNAPAHTGDLTDDIPDAGDYKAPEHTVRRRRSQRAQRTEDGE